MFINVSWFRERADDNRVLAPAEGGGVGGFCGGERRINPLGHHATGEDLEWLLFVGLGGELGEGFVEFGGLRAGDDLDDIRPEWRGDLDFESAFVRAGNINHLVGGDEGVAAPAVREEDDGCAVALVADDGNVAFLGTADPEADVLAFGVGAFAVGGEDFDLEVLRDLGEASVGDLLHVGEALLDVLGSKDVCHVLRGGGCGVWPDFGFHLVERDREPGLADFAAFEPGEFGIDGDVVAGVVEPPAHDPLDALDGDLFDAGAGFEDLLALEFAFELEVGQSVACDDFEFAGLAESDFEFVAQEGRERGEQVSVLVGEVADANVHLAIRGVGGEVAGELGVGVGRGVRREGGGET